MKIDARYGGDTGMCIVDMYLEPERECALRAEGIWKEHGPLLASHGIPVADVVDCFLHKRNPEGNWDGAGMLSWSAK
jgi:hypothetical protein